MHLEGQLRGWRVNIALAEDLSSVPVVFSESSSVLYGSSGSIHSMFTYPHVYTKRKLNEGHCEKITFMADILSPVHDNVVTLPTLYLLLKYGLCTRAVHRSMLFNHAIRKIQAECWHTKFSEMICCHYKGAFFLM